MSAPLALQTLIRARLLADPAVLALVPADDIADRHGRPAQFPSILFGEAREYPLGSVTRIASRVVVDLHFWTEGAGTAASKTLAAAIQRALRNDPWNAPGFVIMDLRHSGTRFMSDPDSKDVTHGVTSWTAHVLEAA